MVEQGRYLVGISAFYHDSAACLLRDGRIVAAASEERFSRIKHDRGFPAKALAYCLKEGGISLRQVDAVVFYEKPLLKLERILETYFHCAPRGIRSFARGVVPWMREKFLFRRFLREELRRADPSGEEVPLLFSGHHLSHAAGVFFASPFQEAAILVADGVGEWATTSLWYGEGSTLRQIQEIRFPHSLGLLYSSFAYFLGFEVNGGEQKLMGLASYADPHSDAVRRYKKVIVDKLVRLQADGSFSLVLSHFNFMVGETMVSDALWEQFFGIARRSPGAPFTEEHCALAMAIQQVTEEILLDLCKSLREKTGAEALCISGGVALNCVANARIRSSGLFKRVYIPPAPGDAGGAVGAALAARQLFFLEGRAPGPDLMQGGYLGPGFSDLEIEQTLRTHGIPFVRHTPHSLVDAVAELLAAGRTVGWFQGRMEWGPRALGNRSILADARDPKMHERLNRLKRREMFRPFAPVVLEEDAGEYFEEAAKDPYMVFVQEVRRERRHTSRSKSLGERFGEALSDIPAVTHADHSSRLQTVSRGQNPLLYGLLQEFKRRTGYGILVNTSFNVGGEPIVATPEDALHSYQGSDLECLAIGNFLLTKK